MKLPQEWKDISISKFIALHEILTDTELNEFDKTIRVVAISIGSTIQDVENMDMGQFATYTSQLDWMQEMPDKKKIPTLFECGKRIFIFDHRIEKLKAKQYIDLSLFTKDPDQVIANIHNIMAVLCVEDGHNYDSEKHKATAELFFKELPIVIAYPIALFFCNLYTLSVPVIQDYLSKELKKTNSIMERMIVAPSSQNSNGILS